MNKIALGSGSDQVAEIEQNRRPGSGYADDFAIEKRTEMARR